METSKIINSLIIAAALIVVAFLVLIRVDIFLKIKAIDDCGKISKFEKDNPGDNSKVSYPIADFYIPCLKTKGYQAQY